jgi:hypothetical protein
VEGGCVLGLPGVPGAVGSVGRVREGDVGSPGIVGWPGVVFGSCCGVSLRFSVGFCLLFLLFLLFSVCAYVAEPSVSAIAVINKCFIVVNLKVLASLFGITVPRLGGKRQ